jgi:hypothetical protein
MANGSTSESNKPFPSAGSLPIIPVVDHGPRLNANEAVVLGVGKVVPSRFALIK